MIDLEKPYIVPYLNYEYIERQQRMKNIQMVYCNLNNPKFLLKIKKFSEKYQLDYDYILKKIKDDDLFAMQFAIDPTRQSFHQNQAAKFIDNLPFVQNFQLLPPDGPNALYLISGEIKKGKDIKNRKNVKSIDFQWEYEFKNNKIFFFATHKYTKDSGGSQDNQLNDVFSFHENAKDCLSQNIFLYSITDGDYYQTTYKKNKQIDPLPKIDYMNRQYMGCRNYATTTNNLLPHMLNVIFKWLNANFENDEISETIKYINYILDSYKNI